MTPLDALNESLEQPIAAEDLRSMVRAAIQAVTGVSDDAFDENPDLQALGLDSLAVTEVLLELEDRIGIELPAEVLATLDDADLPERLEDVYRLLVG